MVVGFIMPWIIISKADGTVWATSTGFAVAQSYHSAYYSPLGGLALVVIGIFDKGRLRKLFSVLGGIVSILCGLLLTNIGWFYYNFLEIERNASLSYGLTFISFLGVVLGFVGCLKNLSASETLPRYGC